jgi:flagellum-specific peptidoglycan hydrolase FlgJ
MKKIVSLMIITLMASTLLAQVDANYQAYIEKYKDLAITEQERHAIPASITMAQA